MHAAGLSDIWPRMVRAAGENALQCYRAEVEAAMRTEGYSGISLLSLQDFPGQGTALVGMMNAHMRPKPYPFADPARFAVFFRDVLPLALLPRFVFTSGEEISFPVRIANYGKAGLEGPCAWSLSGDGVSLPGETASLRVPAGSLSGDLEICFRLPDLPAAARLDLALDFCGNANTYPLWVYPDEEPVCPGDVLECRVLDETAWQVLSGGGRVFLSPDSTAEAGAGATGCAVGSHACRGKRPALAPKPAMDRKATQSRTFSFPAILAGSSTPPAAKPSPVP